MMSTNTIDLWAGHFVVVETDTDVFIGTLEVLNDHQVRLMTGLRGRPPIVDIVDIESISNPHYSDLVEAISR